MPPWKQRMQCCLNDKSPICSYFTEERKKSRVCVFGAGDWGYPDRVVNPLRCYNPKGSWKEATDSKCFHDGYDEKEKLKAQKWWNLSVLQRQSTVWSGSLWVHYYLYALGTEGWCRKRQLWIMEECKCVQVNGWPMMEWIMLAITVKLASPHLASRPHRDKALHRNSSIIRTDLAPARFATPPGMG